MHAQKLAEMAARIAIDSLNPLRENEDITSNLAEQYWTASKCRILRWNQALKMFANDLREQNLQHDPWPAIQVVVEEVLISELLTRVWSAVLTSHDHLLGRKELSGIAYSIYISHLETSNRALKLMLIECPKPEGVVEKVNLIRRRVERWTDVLLSFMPNIENSKRLAFEPDRVADFHGDREQMDLKSRRQSNQLLLASLITDLQQNSGRYTANPDLNRRIAAGVLQFFPSDRFDSTGVEKSSAMIWIEKTQLDTQILIDQFLRSDRESTLNNSRFMLASDSRN